MQGIWVYATAHDLVNKLKENADAIEAKLLSQGLDSKGKWDNPEWQPWKEVWSAYCEADEARKHIKTDTVDFQLDVQITPIDPDQRRDWKPSQEETIIMLERVLVYHKNQEEAMQNTLDLLKARGEAVTRTLDLLKKDRDAKDESERCRLWEEEQRQKETRRRQSIDTSTLVAWSTVTHTTYDHFEGLDEQIETLEMYGRLYLEKFSGRTNTYRLGWKWEPNYACFTNLEYKSFKNYMEQPADQRDHKPEAGPGYKTFEEGKAAYDKKRAELGKLAKDQLERELGTVPTLASQDGA
jgi:hypothetical protein